MKSFRTVLQSPNDLITVELPVEFRRRTLEVVVNPIADKPDPDSPWPPGFFTRIAGAWSGAPLERPPQGTPEVRSTLD